MSSKNIKTNNNFNLQENEIDFPTLHCSTSIGTVNTTDRENSIPSDYTYSNENTSNSNSNSNSDNNIKHSKKNNKYVSEEIIKKLFIELITSDPDNSQKVKFKRNYINYIIADYFGLMENKIKRKYRNEIGKEMISMLTKIKEIIKNNSCSYKIKYLILSNDIKKDILEILINKSISISIHKKDELTVKISKMLLEVLEVQNYSFLDRITDLRNKISSEFSNAANKDFYKELLDMSHQGINSSTSNPWNEKKIAALDSLANGLKKEEFKKEELLGHKLRNSNLSEKCIFRIAKDYTSYVSSSSQQSSEFDECSSKSNNSNSDLKLSEESFPKFNAIDSYEDSDFYCFFYQSLFSPKYSSMCNKEEREVTEDFNFPGSNY